MKKVSAKRQKQYKTYYNIKNEMLKNNIYNMYCFLCGGKINIPPNLDNEGQLKCFEIHHIEGERENHHLIDENILRPVHLKCHREYHSKSVYHIKWFPRYLNYLKLNNYQKLFIKETDKFNKL